MHLKSQRGQTMPFWVVGVLITLTLVLFVANYANSIGWQIRAQNAADDAAATALEPQASLWNEQSTLLYTAAVQEFRIRTIEQSLLNISQSAGGCTTNCASDWSSLRAEFISERTNFNNTLILLNAGNTFTASASDMTNAQAKISSNCVTGDYTCSFTYTKINADSTQADYVACKSVPYFTPLIFGFSNTAKFKALGRGAAQISSVNSEAFSPGTAVNSQTGLVYQPIETQWALDVLPAYSVNFSGLTVNLNWYAPVPMRPYSGNLLSSAYTCP